jgi:hypothetical protein
MPAAGAIRNDNLAAQPRRQRFARWRQFEHYNTHRPHRSLRFWCATINLALAIVTTAAIGSRWSPPISNLPQKIW